MKTKKVTQHGSTYEVAHVQVVRRRDNHEPDNTAGMYEFMIPQPSRFYRFGMEESNDNVNSGDANNPDPVAPKTLLELGIEDASDLLSTNHQSVAAEYHVSVESIPPLTVYAGKSYKGEGGHAASSYEFNDIKVVEGYNATKVYYQLSMRHSGNFNLKAYNDRRASFAWGLWHDPGLAKRGCKKNSERALAGYKRFLQITSENFKDTNWYEIKNESAFSNIKYKVGIKTFVKVRAAAEERIKKLEKQ